MIFIMIFPGENDLSNKVNTKFNDHGHINVSILHEKLT